MRRKECRFNSPYAVLIGEAFKNVFPLVIDSLNLAQPTHKEQFYGVEEEASEIKEKKEKGRVGVSRKLID